MIDESRSLRLDVVLSSNNFSVYGVTSISKALPAKGSIAKTKPDNVVEYCMMLLTKATNRPWADIKSDTKSNPTM